MAIILDDGLKDEIASVYKWYATRRAKVLYGVIGFLIGVIITSVIR